MKIENVEISDETVTEMARMLRLGIIQQQYEVGNLTEEQARELLRGRLDPDDEKSVVDDSELLKVTK